LDLHDVAPIVVDKHSSGGVGDKTTLVVQPLVAACGVPVGKMSGRGLGSSGGTLDKMESFSRWGFQLTLPAFKKQLAEIGLVLAGQSISLAPADGKIYALRDVTGTVASVPLIAASIMSKKLAAGADAIVLDVKTGNGAFMQTVEEAEVLGQLMVNIGRNAGRKTVALISDMNQHLGIAVGNALEVKEALETLRGNGPQDFWLHCQKVGGLMLLLAGKSETLEGAEATIAAARDSGRGLEKFRAMVVAQGGDGRQVDDPALLPRAQFVEDIRIKESGTISRIDAAKIGWACFHLGGGRKVKNEPIDHAVGFILPFKVGDTLQAGQAIGTVQANDRQQLEQAREQILAAITLSQEPVDRLPHFYGIIE
jgi:pyrimidine-nucleoside phosphorylase